MNALTKFSIALLVVTVTAIAVYLYVAPESYDATRPRSGQSQPQDAICRQDEERLARLRAKPSLDEGLRFVSEIRCLQLWPQLQMVMDGLTSPLGSTASSGPAGSDTMSGRDDARQTEPAAGAASAALDDACRRDEDRLAELQANPTVEAAIRFDSELSCPRLQPQLLAILKRLSGAAASIAAHNQAAPASETSSASEPASSVSPPSGMEAAPSASDDACKRDEDRLAELQAKPSLDEAVRFEGELKCSKLQPQLLAILDGLSRAPEAPPPAASTGPVCPESTGKAAPEVPAPPALEPSGSETTSASVPQDAGAEKTAANELPPASQAATDGERRIAELESEKEALAAKVSQLERDREASSADEAKSAPPQHAAPETQPNSQVAADAQRRIAQLESENEALTAEVSRLQRDWESAVAEPTHAASLPPPSAAPEQSETQPAPQAAADAKRRIAELENEKEALAAKVSQLEHDRQASPADEAPPVQSPPPAATAERSYSIEAAALASLPEGMPARVLIRYLANKADARAQAENLTNALTRQGIEVVDLRPSASAIRTELSFAYAPDEAIAQQVARLAGVAAVRRLQPKDGLMVRPGTVELNLSGESHLAAIKATSSRESNHE
jgi:hypothetical protein